MGRLENTPEAVLGDKAEDRVAVARTDWSERKEYALFFQVFAAEACSARPRRTAGTCKKWALVNEFAAVLGHVQRAGGDVDGVVADALEVVDRQEKLGDLVHQVFDPLAGGAGLDEVPADGAGGTLAEPIDLVVALVDGEAGLKSSSA